MKNLAATTLVLGLALLPLASCSSRPSSSGGPSVAGNRTVTYEVPGMH